MNKNKSLINAIGLAALFFALLLPPEAYPNGKLAVVLCATFAFLGALSERRIPRSFLTAGAWIFGLLLLHTFTVSIDLYRSLEMLTIIWAYYCLIGFFSFNGSDFARPLAASMLVLTLIVAGYGLYQYFWGFDKIQSYIFYAASDQVVKAPALGLIAARRVSSTVALPGTLWGFLVCALPFHGMLWGRRRWLDAVIVISVTTLLAAGFLTRSFGFLLGMSVVAFVGVWLRYRRIVWNRVTPVIVVAAVLAGAFYSARRGVIEGADPAGLRFMNWASAWNIFAVHPWGTGLNTFGVIYPEYMQPLANETQFVHNTPLQLLSELGLPLLAGIVLILVLKAPMLSSLIRKRPETFWLVLAVAGWVVHNIVDIDIYFGSVGVMGAILLGTLFAREPSDNPQSVPLVAAISVLSVAAIIFSGVACISTELQHRAQIEFENKKLTTAVETLNVARWISPINSSLHHETGEILLNLFQTTKDPRYQAEAIDAFKRAVELSPEKAGSHVGYGLSLSSASRMPEALDQIRIAQGLYPSSSYIQSIRQLMAKRIY